MKDIDFRSTPKVPFEEILKKYPENLLLIIEDILKDRNGFNMIFQDMIDMMKYGFEKEEIRKKAIFYKFHKNDKETRVMPMNHFISNLIFWQPMIDIEQGDIIDESWIFDFKNFNSNSLMNYINDKILPIYNMDFASQNVMVDQIYHYIISISHAFCLLTGMGISLYDLHQLELRDPEVMHLMRDPVNQDLEPHEIEEELSKRNSRLIEKIKMDPVGNDYKPFFASGTGLKDAQFREYIVRIGFKADINGNTVPILIDSNFLLHGLNKPSYLYLNGISGRKALILSKLSMGKPGAFSKKLTYNSVTSVLRSDYEMCDSILTVNYHIINDTFLKLLNGRYYYDANGELCLLDYNTDKDLIGKIVRFRSPVTCNSTNGVCKYCYGHMFDINRSMASPGALASLKITEPIGQGVLSSKHSQTTSSNELKFSEGYNDVFDTTSSMVTLREDSDMDAEIYIKLTNVQVEEMDDSEFFYVESFDLIDENGELIRKISEESGARFYLNDRLIQMYKRRLRQGNCNETIIALDEIDADEALFTIEVKNKELTEPLKIFTKILNNNDHMGAKTIDELCQIFAEKLIQMNIKYELTHAEMILRALIRKKSNIHEFPNFGMDGNLNDYQILKLDEAQLHNPSVLLSLPYGYLRKQLLSADLYKKTQTGPLDPLYVSRLSDFI